jgi:hypothetical protein
MGMKWTIALGCLFLFGCSTASLDTRFSKGSPNAPINEINGGIVSYLNQGAKSVIQDRRQDAYRKMHDACQGPYKILQEGEQLGEGMATPIGDSVIYTQERRWQIKFECAESQVR